MHEPGDIPPKDPLLRGEWDKEIKALASSVNEDRVLTREGMKPHEVGFRDLQLFRAVYGDTAAMQALYLEWFRGGSSIPYPPEVVQWLKREVKVIPSRNRKLARAAAATITKVYEESRRVLSGFSPN